MAEPLARRMQAARRSKFVNAKPAKPNPVAYIGIVGLCLSSVAAAQAPPDSETPAAKQFSQRIAEYVAIHNKADAAVPSLKKTDDPTEISTREKALGDAIRAMRSGARPGDILNRDIASELRRLIKKDYRSRTPQERKIFLDEMPHFHPKVNQAYPSEWPLATFPASLLEVMPKLPDILEYRLLSEALILRDVKANIVVDFILDVY